MPAWILNLLIQLAIKVGVPALVKYFPKIPSEIIAIINELIDALKQPEVSNSAAKKSAMAKVRSQLQVSPQPQDLKKG